MPPHNIPLPPAGTGRALARPRPPTLCCGSAARPHPRPPRAAGRRRRGWHLRTRAAASQSGQGAGRGRDTGKGAGWLSLAVATACARGTTCPRSRSQLQLAHPLPYLLPQVVVFEVAVPRGHPQPRLVCGRAMAGSGARRRGSAGQAHMRAAERWAAWRVPAPAHPQSCAARAPQTAARFRRGGGSAEAGRGGRDSVGPGHA